MSTGVKVTLPPPATPNTKGEEAKRTFKPGFHEEDESGDQDRTETWLD